MKELKRTVLCGKVSKEHVGRHVTLNGWVDTRRDHGGVIFIDLRDRTGIVQLVFNPDTSHDMKKAHALRSEFVIAVKGELVLRAPELINHQLTTGAYEVRVEQCEILSQAKTLPFQLDEAENVSEDLRLTYRYFDLRRPSMQRMLALRHKVLTILRENLNENDFIEVETPILSKSTPEGARDYLVPSRLQPHNFYALPQSPQIYKQLLMCAGLDRYYQIARCFRDEDLRADRQPEFTQLDIEASFIDEEDIYHITESFIKQLFKDILGITLESCLPRYTYDEMFARFGSDRPDDRFDLRINDITHVLHSIDLGFLQSIFKNKGRAGALCVKNNKFTRSELEGWVTRVKKEFGAKGLLYIRFNEDGTPNSPIAKFLPNDFLQQLQKNAIPDITLDDTLFVVADEYKDAWTLLGKLRLCLGQELKLIDTKKESIFWVTDFPMFEWDKDLKRWFACHHPFTQPQQGWESSDIGDIKARAYDLVWNGYEIGGGSIRIHDSTMQEKIFEILGLGKEEAYEKFGFLMEAQNLGYPPEGGIALGIERLIMMFAKTTSIRDVIAFPKTQRGGCLMMDSPNQVDRQQLDELFIALKDKKNDA